jgi:hypothetical protein
MVGRSSGSLTPGRRYPVGSIHRRNTMVSKKEIVSMMMTISNRNRRNRNFMKKETHLSFAILRWEDSIASSDCTSQLSRSFPNNLSEMTVLDRKKRRLVDSQWRFKREVRMSIRVVWVVGSIIFGFIVP